MRTTLDLPESLFREAKAKAALEGTTLKELFGRYIMAGLGQTAARSTERSPLPVISKKGKQPIPNLTPAIQSQLEGKEDFAKLNRSFRR